MGIDRVSAETAEHYRTAREPEEGVVAYLEQVKAEEKEARLDPEIIAQACSVEAFNGSEHACLEKIEAFVKDGDLNSIYEFIREDQDRFFKDVAEERVGTPCDVTVVDMSSMTWDEVGKVFNW